jgi:glycosyltransferase involved in cell wall biosynthesis
VMLVANRMREVRDAAARPVEVGARRPVRVCFLIDRLATAGTETQLLALLRHLDRARVQPFLCLLDGEDEVSRALEPRDCPVLRLGVRSLHRPSTLAAAYRFRGHLRAQEIDVLQAYFADSAYFGVPAARWAGVPWIIRTQNNLGHWMKPIHRWAGRLCQRWTHATIANCAACGDAAVRLEGARRDAVVVLPNGVDLERFAGVPLPPARREPCRVGLVANLRPVKDIETFIGVAARLASPFPDVSFHVAGEGSHRPALEALVRRLGLQERVVLPGLVSDMPSFLASLDVAVLCSRAEGMSNAVLEYMAAARPIAATAVGANVELLRHGVDGLIVAPGNAEELSAAVSTLLTDAALARRLGAAARAKVARGYSLESRARRFEDFYENLRERRRREVH